MSKGGKGSGIRKQSSRRTDRKASLTQIKDEGEGCLGRELGTGSLGESGVLPKHFEKKD